MPNEIMIIGDRNMLGLFRQLYKHDPKQFSVSNGHVLHLGVRVQPVHLLGDGPQILEQAWLQFADEIQRGVASDVNL